MESVHFDPPSETRIDEATPTNLDNGGSLYGGGGVGGKARRNRRATAQIPYKRPETGRHAAAGHLAAAIATATHNQNSQLDGGNRGVDGTLGLDPVAGSGGGAQNGSLGWMSRWSLGSLKSLVKWPWAGAKPAGGGQGALGASVQGGSSNGTTAVAVEEHQQAAAAGTRTNAEPGGAAASNADVIIKGLEKMPLPEMEQVLSFLQYKLTRTTPTLLPLAAPGFRSPDRNLGSQMLPFGEHRSIFTTPQSVGVGVQSARWQERLPAGSAEKFHTPTGSGPDGELDPVEMARSWMGNPLALKLPTTSPKPVSRPGNLYPATVRARGEEGRWEGQAQVQRDARPGRSFLTQGNQGEGSAYGALSVTRWAPATEPASGGRELLKRRRSVLDAGWAAPPSSRRMRVKPSYAATGARRNTLTTGIYSSPADRLGMEGERAGGSVEGARDGGAGGSWVGGRGVGSLVPSESNLTAKRILEMLDRYSSPPATRKVAGRLEAGGAGGLGTSGGRVGEQSLLAASLNERGKRSMMEVEDVPPPVESVEAAVGGLGGMSGNGRDLFTSTPAQFQAASQAIEMARGKGWGGAEASKENHSGEGSKRSRGFRFFLADDVEAEGEGVSGPGSTSAPPTSPTTSPKERASLSPPRRSATSATNLAGAALPRPTTGGNGSASGFSFAAGAAAMEPIPTASKLPPGTSQQSGAPPGAGQSSTPSDIGVPRFAFGNAGVKVKGGGEAGEMSPPGGKDPEYAFTVRPAKSPTSPPTGTSASLSPPHGPADTPSTIPLPLPTVTSSQPSLWATAASDSLFASPLGSPLPPFMRTSGLPAGDAPVDTAAIPGSGALESNATAGAALKFGASSMPPGSGTSFSLPSPTPSPTPAPAGATPASLFGAGSGASSGPASSAAFLFGAAAATGSAVGATGGFNPQFGSPNPAAAGFGTGGALFGARGESGGGWDAEGGARAGKRSAPSSEPSQGGGIAGGVGGSQPASVGASFSPFGLSQPAPASQEIPTAAPAASGFNFGAAGNGASGGGTPSSTPAPIFSFAAAGSKPAASASEAAASPSPNPFGSTSSGTQLPQSIFGSTPAPIFGATTSPSPSSSPWPAPIFGSSGTNETTPASNAKGSLPAPSFGAPSTLSGFSAPTTSPAFPPIGSNPFGAPMPSAAGSMTSSAFGAVGGFPPPASTTSGASPFLFSATGSTATPSTFTFNSKPTADAPVVFGGFGGSSPAPSFGGMSNGGGSLGMEDSMAEDPFSPTKGGGNMGGFNSTPLIQQPSPTSPAPFLFQQQQPQQQGAPGAAFSFGAMAAQPTQPNPFGAGPQITQFGGPPAQGMANPFGGDAPKPGGLTFSVGGGGEDKGVRRVVKAKRPGGVRRK